MHPQRRTKTDARTTRSKNSDVRSPHPRTAPPQANALSSRGSAPDAVATGERQVNLSLPVPRITGVSAVGAGSGLIVAVATGNVEPVYVWPCVALAGLGMAYDLARRLLARPPRR